MDERIGVRNMLKQLKYFQAVVRCNSFTEAEDAQLDSINVAELKNIPCILIASQNQRDNELTYYRDVIGFSGEVFFAENLEEARFMVLGGRGFMPIEGGKPERFGSAIRRVALCRDGNPIKRNYCAFWKADNSGCYIEEFADILKSQFSDEA